MTPCCISNLHLPKASALYLDYLYHYDRVGRFYSGTPHAPTSYRNVAQAIAGTHPHREALLEILTRQNRAFGCDQMTFANLDHLRDSRTFAVVTGQQVGLFSGPAFTIYKALTAVMLARHLSQQGLPCVPVFWLATEDHDLEEVSSASILDDAGEMVTLRVSGERPAANSPVGNVKLSSEVDGALAHVEQLLPTGEPRDWLLQGLRESYAAGMRWGESFGRFMARLFSRFGVILLDPLDAQVHELARPSIEYALEEAPRLRSLLQERSQNLVHSGYHAQVHVADDSTLLFATRDGSRTVIRQRGEEFLVEGANPSPLRQFEEWVARSPLDFTPSALLRPVVQDMLLPTVAYVAGPSELAYFGQSQVIYPEFGRPAPVIFPRAGFTLASHREERLLEKYHLTVEDVWQGEEYLRRKIAVVADGDGTQAWSARIDGGEAEMKRLFEGLGEEIGRLDPTLTEALRHTQEKMSYQLEKLRGKISRAAISRSELLSRHERELARFFMPSGNLQEREVSGIQFLGQTGSELLDRLLDRIRPDCADHQFFVY
ncbi:MAG: bacillithiol biosynthesis cysteine-adding enzyme BshC [Terriglobia bacterium]